MVVGSGMVWLDTLPGCCLHFCLTDRPSIDSIGQHVGHVAVFAVDWGYERPSCESFAAI